MRHNRQQLVREIVQAADPPQQPIREDGQRDPMLPMRTEKVAQISDGPCGEELPIVDPEPGAAGPSEPQSQRHYFRHTKRDNRSSTGDGPRPAGATVTRPRPVA